MVCEKVEICPDTITFGPSLRDFTKIDGSRWVLIRFSKTKQNLKAICYGFLMHHPLFWFISSIFSGLWKSRNLSWHLGVLAACAISTARGVIDRGAYQVDLYIIRVGTAKHSSHSKEHPICDCLFTLLSEFTVRKAVSICYKRPQLAAR